MSLLTTLIGIERQKEIDTLQKKLKRATEILHTNDEIKTLDLALEQIICEFEQKNEVEDNSEEIESVFDLNYGKPKKIYEIEAEFEFVGRGKPLPFDFSDVDFEEENQL